MKNVLTILLCAAMFASSTVWAEEIVEDKSLDLGDSSSQTITGKAWESLGAKDYDNTIKYARACIKLYEKEAIATQESLTEPIESSDKDAVSSKWALNDVGTCYFIIGQALEAQDKKAEAADAYKQLLKKVSFAQCWDPQGWFWKPADAAKKQIKVIELETADDE
jgi:tetratricopeptide (TPR) repeat protein